MAAPWVDQGLARGLQHSGGQTYHVPALPVLETVQVGDPNLLQYPDPRSNPLKLEFTALTWSTVIWCRVDWAQMFLGVLKVGINLCNQFICEL